MENNFFKILFRNDNRPFLVVLSVLILVQVIFMSYVLFDSKQPPALPSKQETVVPAQEEVFASSGNHNVLPEQTPQLKVSANDPKIETLINKVFRHIFLPNGDVRVETVVKPDELKTVNPVFYQFAKVGDQILIYADRAILYDPIADQVLDVQHFSEGAKLQK